ncbi:DUF1697 domain-containing protein [Sinomonas susongensis]|uniref:DUF1697 domain-containing protein n=1 Tax=Sinomonas susongensis TaxID=1324851 RepID=UPI001486E470|nr:DUF1697 domain-containing protein [Sinomonas susongensis]
MCAGFYRNLNLGHPGSPTRAVLEAELREAGARRVVSVGANGTALIEAEEPEEVFRASIAALEKMAGYRGAVMVRTFSLLASIVDRKPFGGRGDGQLYRETFTFFDGGKPLCVPLPWTNGRGDVDIIDVSDGVALGVTRWTGSGPGSPGAEIERLTGAITTTRTRGTIERLVTLGRAW